MGEGGKEGRKEMLIIKNKTKNDTIKIILFREREREREREVIVSNAPCSISEQLPFISFPVLHRLLCIYIKKKGIATPSIVFGFLIFFSCFTTLHNLSHHLGPTRPVVVAAPQ